jgi:spore coat polysaccharide biosynthesis predicted glycosyltransferase SpsG
MAQRKAIFIGRNSPDNGLPEYRKLAKHLGVKLDEYINVPNASKYLKKYDLAFVSRYLAIMEALTAGLPVFAHYNNQIKFDYLNMAPFAKYITIFKDYREVRVQSGQAWAKQQTWDSVADIYEKLWKK